MFSSPVTQVSSYCMTGAYLKVEQQLYMPRPMTLLFCTFGGGVSPLPGIIHCTGNWHMLVRGGWSIGKGQLS